jgi:dihydroneopterin aldolase
MRKDILPQKVLCEIPETLLMIYSIYLKNVRFFAYHGLYPEEAVNGNFFEIDLTVKFTKDRPIHSIEETIDYAALYELLKQEMNIRRQLLETLGRDICELIKMKYPKIISTELNIRKINAPIPDFSGTTGISIIVSYD